MNTKDFYHIKKGDTVVRLLAGTIRMPLVVAEVDEHLIHAGWTFLRSNGAEVDEDLGWDGIHLTGSILENS